jgi:hypothetical protein
MSDLHPLNGTRYRLESVEQAVTKLDNELSAHIQVFNALNTYLTGSGVKDAKGLLGSIADSLKDLAKELKEYHEAHDHEEEINKDVVIKEIQKQLAEAVVVRQASRWNNLSKFTKGLIIAGASTIGGSLVVSSIGNIIHYLSTGH